MDSSATVKARSHREETGTLSPSARNNTFSAVARKINTQGSAAAFPPLEQKNEGSFLPRPIEPALAFSVCSPNKPFSGDRCLSLPLSLSLCSRKGFFARDRPLSRLCFEHRLAASCSSKPTLNGLRSRLRFPWDANRPIAPRVDKHTLITCTAFWTDEGGIRFWEKGVRGSGYSGCCFRFRNLKLFESVEMRR